MKRWWLWAGLGVMLLLIAAQQIWARGTWQDPVLGTTVVEATGSEVAGTLTAGALLAGAALLAGLVGSRPVRLAAAVCLAGGALLAGLPAVLTLGDPGEPLGQIARQRPGAASLSVHIDDPTTTLWPWLALGAAVLVLLGAVLCVLRWFDTGASRSPGGGAAATGTTPPGVSSTRRRERPRDPWDDLTHGQDPTVDD
ncbi:Trp biosynthesis-associated membrane protein [Ornithinimicrobium faecis]|uniref:Trp biosynthesis-associated membrane protein n=1 Tax=Ornithinimicrobium faecis TaxID=2934158 RepID=A0ABY4YPX6_9MICO|nr:MULTISPECIES: Trp biosynthesis-associated membrane protein [unclassified Ornithinimicrobium]USQ78320.1 Trp biosynthesis-associated membrane protein [Ornithinimicrobium sp. HY1793]